MSKRTEFYLRFVIPMKYRLRRRVIWWLENAVDRLNIDQSTRFDDAVTFRDFITDADLFAIDDDDDYNNY